MNLSDSQWWLWRDTDATWKDDKLYLPTEITDLSILPVNVPTGGWNKLDQQQAISVKVPGTVEEYFTTSDSPRPEDLRGVSWWFRTLEVPEQLKERRFILHFESVRMRAEVYIDKQLVAYDIIGESPFQADITPFIRPGEKQQLAVRVTNPGGNFHWQDFDIYKWGSYNVPPGRGFGGIIGRVKMEAVHPIHISDLYIQNTPDIKSINAIISIQNNTSAKAKQDLEVIVREKKNPEKIVFQQTLKKQPITEGLQTMSIPVTVPDAHLWDLNSPELYTCEVRIKSGKKILDHDQKVFGFRWFTVDGIGKDAVLRLNGRRVMLRSAISWGYWPVTGLIATPEMAEKQIETAQVLGLNTLNFHRSIGSPVVLEKADEMGLLYYEEPGSFHSANHDPFIRSIVNEKLKRMVRRDRSHPSLVIYNLINEFGGVLSRDKELVAKRMNDMREAHAVDPSRIMTFTSGWAGSEHAEEDSKAHMLPFDTTLYRKGWFDNHRAGGPETWLEEYYKGPEDNFMYTDNRTEIYFRGEEGALSTPPRIQKIHETITSSGESGWDGKFWEKQYQSFSNMFREKQLEPYFGNIDSLTRLMGNVSFEHQGRRIQGMRMQNIGDGYMVNGWEAMPYDNHSGIVDIYRNPKGDVSLFNYYTQPLYIAVSSRSQIVRLPADVSVDFYIINEKDLKGSYALQINVVDPAGNIVHKDTKPVIIKGDEVFGQLLLENITLPIRKEGGKYKITAQIVDADGNTYAKGHDEVLAVDWNADSLKGKGAYYGKDGDKFAGFYMQQTGNPIEAFTPETKSLDWLVVTRPSLDEPMLIDPGFFLNKDGQSTLQVSFYKDNDMRDLAQKKPDTKIDRHFAGGAQPDASVPANQAFSVVWEGELLPTESGQYLIGLSSNSGIRLSVNGQRMIDNWGNRKPVSLDRPVMLEAGKPATIRVEYTQNAGSGEVQLKWSRPTTTAIEPQLLIDRVKNDGTTLILLNAAESWMNLVAQNTGVKYNGYYSVGRNWVGGIHFVKDHPLFKGLPVNDALNWPYQAVARNGDQRFGFRISGEEMVVGSYKSTPFELGTAVGILPCGKGKIIFSSLDILDNLDQPSGPSDVAKKILCNYISYYNTKFE
ncbi:PA14 domain-containing protein [Bacteroides sp. 51]|uniref:PA14 domain-containing protein n=1 Tax=Bacteroides sp. 51 TaxID=2302938 RepID=UPI001EF3550D|nr:PA14 domain-containing protein [Bacteroides sp. 51]